MIGMIRVVVEDQAAKGTAAELTCGCFNENVNLKCIQLESVTEGLGVVI